MDQVVTQPAGAAFRYWSQDAPLSRVLREASGAMARQSLPTRTLLSALRAGKVLYYSRPIEDVDGFPASDVEPRRWLYTDRAAEGNSTTWWVGGNGATTATHYDMSHNFFVQVGRYTMYPVPRYPVYLYP